MNSGLISGECIVKSFNVFLHELKIFHSKAYDLSSITSLELGTRFSRYSFDFWNTILKQYVLVEGNRAESTGFFQLSFN